MSTVLQNFIQTLLRKFDFAGSAAKPMIHEWKPRPWMRRQDQSVVVYWEDLEEKPDMILEQDFHVDLWIENLGFTLHITP